MTLKKQNKQQGISTPVVVGLVVAGIVIIGIIIALAGSPDQEDGTGMMSNDDAMMEDDEMMEEGESMPGEEDTMMEEDEMMEGDSMSLDLSGEVLAGNTAKLLVYNQADYEKALASDKLVVLYFYANWCPICREETQDALYPAFDSLESDQVVGFRVNYNDNETSDAEEELAREFGVAYQHTKVFLKDGERVLKSPESWDQARYEQEINARVN